MTTQSNSSNAGALPGADPGRLIRLPAALDLVGLGRSAWLELVQRKAAPQPIKIGRATCWVEGEVREFIAQRIRSARGSAR